MNCAYLELSNSLLQGKQESNTNIQINILRHLIIKSTVNAKLKRDKEFRNKQVRNFKMRLHIACVFGFIFLFHYGEGKLWSKGVVHYAINKKDYGKYYWSYARI